MSTDADDPRLTAYALGELEGADRVEVESLLATSPEARRFVAETRAAADLLAAALGAEPSPGLSIVQRVELAARLDRPRHPRVPVRAIVATAAAALLIAAGYEAGRRSASVEGPVRLADADAVVAPAAGVDAVPAPAGPPRSGSSPEPEAEGLGVSVATAPAEPEAVAEVGAVLKKDVADEEGDVALVRREADEPPAAVGLVPGVDRPAPAMSGGMAGAGMGADVAAREAEDLGRLSERSARSEAVDENMMGQALERQTPRGRLDQRGGAAGPPAAVVEAAEPTAAGLEGREPQIQGFGMADSPPTPALRQPAMTAPLATEPGAAAVPLRAAGPTAAVAGRALSFHEDAVPAQAAVAPDRSRFATVRAPDAIEVVDLPEGTNRRLAVPEAPIYEVMFNDSGEQLLVTTEDRSVMVLDVASGATVNALRVAEGPPPEARFGPGNTVVLWNFAVPRATWPGFVTPEEAPVAALPVGIVPMTVEEFAPLMDDGSNPFPIGRLIAGLPVEVEPTGDAPIALGLAAVVAPWDAGRRLVRVALDGRDDGGGAEEVRATVEFNPARVAAYRRIGDDAQPVGLPPPGGGAPTASLPAGRSLSFFFEVVPTEPLADALSALKYQRPGPALTEAAVGAELLTVDLAYRVAGEAEPRTVEAPLADEPRAAVDVAEDLRLAVAVAWLGRALLGDLDDPVDALDGAAALVRSCSDDYVPEVRRGLLDLIVRAGHRIAPPALAAPVEP